MPHALPDPPVAVQEEKEHRKDQGPDEDPQETPGGQAADDAGEDYQDVDLAPLGDEHGPYEVVNGAHHEESPYGQENGGSRPPLREEIGGPWEEHQGSAHEGDYGQDEHGPREKEGARKPDPPPPEPPEEGLDARGEGDPVDHRLEDLLCLAEYLIPLVQREGQYFPYIVEDLVTVPEHEEGCHGDHDQLVERPEGVAEEAPGNGGYVRSEPSSGLPESVTKVFEVLHVGGEPRREPMRKKFEQRGHLDPLELLHEVSHLAVKPDTFPGDQRAHEAGGDHQHDEDGRRGYPRCQVRPPAGESPPVDQQVKGVGEVGE